MACSENIVGPYTKTTFLGCSVTGFTATAGWNGQASELTVNLVEDCDEKFKTPNIGQPIYFKADEFEFGGLLQSYIKNRSTSGDPVYTVKIVDPRPILEHTQVILDQYIGPVSGLHNLLNVYGYLEYMRGFGGSMRTARGIPWNLIRAALQDLAGNPYMVGSSFTTGGLRFRGKTSGSNATYIVDLSEIASTVFHSSSYRISGPVVSLSDLLNQVCADAGQDYYVELRQFGDKNIIKIRTINRRNAIALGGKQIKSFVDSSDYMITNSVGSELRAEVNSCFLIGGNWKYMGQGYGVTPFWGYDALGNFITAYHTGSENGWVVSLDFRKINLALNNTVPAIYADVGENELRYAMGDYESFVTNLLSTNTGTTLYNYYKDIGVTVTDIVRHGAMAGAGGRRVGAAADDESGEPDSQILRDAQTLHSWLSSYAGEFYGKQFLVKASVQMSVDTEGGHAIFSDEPSTDGGWTDSAVLALSPGISQDFFKDDSGKMQPILAFWGSNVDTKQLSGDEYLTNGTYIWMKASMEDKWVIGTTSMFGMNTVNALLKVSSAVVKKNTAIDSNMLLDSTPAVGADTVAPEVAAAKNHLGAQEHTVRAIAPPAVMAGAAAVPLKSNLYTYPMGVSSMTAWMSVGKNPGMVRCEVDEGLTPWDYGSTAAMLAGGTAKIISASTQMQTSDRGEVSVPGYPTKLLGQVLSSTSSLSKTVKQGVSLAGGHYYYLNTNAQSGGASISNINVTVGTQGVTTSYTVTTFTPVFGRFAKGNAEHIKQIGLNRLRAERDMRAKIALRAMAFMSGARSLAQYQTTLTIGKKDLAPRSAAIWFAGQLVPGDDKRKVVIAPSPSTMPYFKGYDDTAVMTMDGFFRPVSKKGSGGLPSITGPTPIACNERYPNQSSGPPPPVAEYTDIPIVWKYLDFLASPDDELVTDTRANGSTKFHDIEGVARGDLGDLGEGASLLISGNHDKMDSDYRFLALRGPLIMQGWGYDLNGKPIPNATVSNISTNYNGSDKFAVDWLEDATTWPVGPVDLRWDRKRGVWTTPASFRMYQIELNQAIDAGSQGEATVIKSKTDIVNADGGTVTTPTITVENWTETSLEAESKALAYFDSADCTYWIIPTASGGGGSGTSGLMNIGYAGCGNVEDIACQSIKSGCLMFGSGLFASYDDSKDDFWVYGPKVGSVGVCSDNVEANHFEVLNFDDGLVVTSSDKCTYTVHGPTIGAGDGSCTSTGDPAGHVTEDDEGKKHTGTNIFYQDGGSAFTSLSFGSGLGIRTGVAHKSNGTGDPVTGTSCSYTIDWCGLLVGSTGCTGTSEGDECHRLVDECLLFGSGLTVSWGDDNVLVQGPRVSGDQACGNSLEATPFDTLIFGSGLKIEVDEDNECAFRVNGPQVGATGCSGNVELSPFSSLVFGSGLTLKGGGCDFIVEGPKISGGDGCGGSVIKNKPFDILIFSSGIGVEEYGNEGECQFKIVGPKAGASGCGNNIEASDFNRLIFSSGLDVVQDGCEFTIKGPKISGEGCGNKFDSKPFATLIFGSGLEIKTHGEDEENCAFQVTGPKLGSSGCQHNIESEPFDELIFSSGLKVTGGDCSFTVEGPKIEGKGCGNTVEAKPFEHLTFGSGLELKMEDEEQCKFVVVGPEAGSTGANKFPAQPFKTLIFASGLKVAGGGCSLTVTGPAVSGTDCGQQFESKSFETLIFGSGLTISKYGEGDGNYRVVGPSLGYEKCEEGSEAVAAEPFTEIIFASGLEVEPGEACSFKVSGPKISANDKAEKSVDASNFSQIVFGSGFKLEQDSPCVFTVNATGVGGGGGCKNGHTELINMVTKICCSGTTFVVENSGLNFVNGCLESVQIVGAPDCTTHTT